MTPNHKPLSRTRTNEASNSTTTSDPDREDSRRQTNVPASVSARQEKTIGAEGLSTSSTWCTQVASTHTSRHPLNRLLQMPTSSPTSASTPTRARARARTGLSSPTTTAVRRHILQYAASWGCWMKWSMILMGCCQMILQMSLWNTGDASRNDQEFMLSTFLHPSTQHGRFQVKPRVVQISHNYTVHSISADAVLPPPRRVHWKIGTVYWLDNRREDPDEGCQFLADWQNDLNPSCSSFHEIDLADYQRNSWVANGYYRDVWMVQDYRNNKVALKTLRYNERRSVGKDAERHRIDALAHAQLTASPHVANIYGYCMTDAIHDFSDGVDLSELFDDDSKIPSKEERLVIARDVAAAIADAHHVDAKGRATIAHTDIKPNNFIRIDGRYVLNDFNRAEMLTWDPKEDEGCTFDFGSNGGRWRSPEEYRFQDETEKVDVWSLGNILYFLLTGVEPFEEQSSDEVVEIVAGGGIPRIADHRILESKHVFDTTLRRALRFCFVRNPEKRATAKEVADLLQDAVAKTG